MPLYNIEHSFPLSGPQKQNLAERITKLHAHTFTTPSIFVQVKFYSQDASAHNHFIGGVYSEASVNRVIAYVRASPSRTKEAWDKLAQQIEHAWYVVVGEASDDEEGDMKKKDDDKGSTETERKAKELVSVGFLPGMIIREKGYPIPEAGQEEGWIKRFRKEFEEKATLGDEGFKSMLDEINEREDLKAWRG